MLLIMTMDQFSRGNAGFMKVNLRLCNTILKPINVTNNINKETCNKWERYIDMFSKCKGLEMY